MFLKVNLRPDPRVGVGAKPRPRDEKGAWKGKMRQGSLWRARTGSSGAFVLFKRVCEVTTMRINYVCRKPHPGGRGNAEGDWGMVWDHLSILQAHGSLCYNSVGSGETRKTGRKSWNQNLKPGQIHRNVSRDSESWARKLTGRGNLGRKHLFSKNNNRRASICEGHSSMHRKRVGRPGLWPREAWDGLKWLLSHFCSLPRWPF